jgi:hypothetical protein
VRACWIVLARYRGSPEQASGSGLPPSGNSRTRRQQMIKQRFKKPLAISMLAA